MEITKKTIIGELVAKDYRTASVFKKNGIDFCCNGNRSIEDACSEKEIVPDDLLSVLAEVSKKESGFGVDYNAWPLDLLADYIEKKHHRYVEEKIEEIKPYLTKVVKAHSDRHPELHEVDRLFNDSVGELTMHMKKEELMLFPYIRKMVQSKQTGEAVKSHFGTVQNPIKVMMHEHDQEGERFRQISELTYNYLPPADACNTYRVMLSLLKEFEEDLHMHIHLENNILFPKSIEMEEAIAQA